MDRRDLTFNSLDDILADAKALSPVGLTATGRWTPAENVEHVSKAIGFTVHGFPECKPSATQKLLFTTMVKLFGKKMLTMKLKPGIKFPKGMEFFEPEPGIAWDEALHRLEQNIADAKRLKMTHPSPVAGDLGHEKWTLMHCRHAELHFSFIHPPKADGTASVDPATV